MQFLLKSASHHIQVLRKKVFCFPAAKFCSSFMVIDTLSRSEWVSLSSAIYTKKWEEEENHYRVFLITIFIFPIQFLFVWAEMEVFLPPNLYPKYTWSFFVYCFLLFPFPKEKYTGNIFRFLLLCFESSNECSRDGNLAEQTIIKRIS